MSEREEKREQLASSLMDFIYLCDEAEAVIGNKDVTYSERVDFSSVVDTVLPLPLDKDSIQGTNLKQLESLVSRCSKCRLSEGRLHTVFGEGVVPARLMVIGEGPGAEEDVTGRPFVGKAGRLFDEILKAVSFSRDDIYITNVVKCRPPNNRNPMPDEMNLCSPFLFSQLQIINPILIVTLGAVPLSFLLDKKNIRITSMRGQLIPYRENTMLFPMFHPSYLLRNPSKAKGSPKFLTWQDIQEVKKIYDQHRQ